MCIANIEKYFQANKLTLNASKTDFIRFSGIRTTDENCQLNVENSNIILKSEVKYLGVIIDSKLNFQAEVKSKTF